MSQNVLLRLWAIKNGNFFGRDLYPRKQSYEPMVVSWIIYSHNEKSGLNFHNGSVFKRRAAWPSGLGRRVSTRSPRVQIPLWPPAPLPCLYPAGLPQASWDSYLLCSICYFFLVIYFVYIAPQAYGFKELPCINKGYLFLLFIFQRVTKGK